MTIDGSRWQISSANFLIWTWFNVIYNFRCSFVFCIHNFTLLLLIRFSQPYQYFLMIRAWITVHYKITKKITTNSLLVNKVLRCINKILLVMIVVSFICSKLSDHSHFHFQILAPSKFTSLPLRNLQQLRMFLHDVEDNWVYIFLQMVVHFFLWC